MCAHKQHSVCSTHLGPGAEGGRMRSARLTVKPCRAALPLPGVWGVASGPEKLPPCLSRRCCARTA